MTNETNEINNIYNNLTEEERREVFASVMHFEMLSYEQQTLIRFLERKRAKTDILYLNHLPIVVGLTNFCRDFCIEMKTKGDIEKNE